MLRFRPTKTYASVVTSPPQVSKTNFMEDPTLMEIETTQCCGPLSGAEKQRRRVNRLCLYCGGPRHIVMNFPHKPRRRVNEVSTHDNPISVSALPSRNLSRPSSPYHKNTFDVLSQLDDVLNE